MRPGRGGARANKSGTIKTDTKRDEDESAGKREEEKKGEESVVKEEKEKRDEGTGECSSVSVCVKSELVVRGKEEEEKTRADVVGVCEKNEITDSTQTEKKRKREGKEKKVKKEERSRGGKESKAKRPCSSSSSSSLRETLIIDDSDDADAKDEDVSDVCGGEQLLADQWANEDMQGLCTTHTYKQVSLPSFRWTCMVFWMYVHVGVCDDCVYRDGLLFKCMVCEHTLQWRGTLPSCHLFVSVCAPLPFTSPILLFTYSSCRSFAHTTPYVFVPLTSRIDPQPGVCFSSLSLVSLQLLFCACGATVFCHRILRALLWHQHRQLTQHSHSILPRSFPFFLYLSDSSRLPLSLSNYLRFSCFFSFAILSHSVCFSSSSHLSLSLIVLSISPTPTNYVCQQAQVTQSQRAWESYTTWHTLHTPAHRVVQTVI